MLQYSHAQMGINTFGMSGKTAVSKPSPREPYCVLSHCDSRQFSLTHLPNAAATPPPAGPGPKVYEYFGFTVDGVVAKAQKVCAPRPAPSCLFPATAALQKEIHAPLQRGTFSP